MLQNPIFLLAIAGAVLILFPQLREWLTDRAEGVGVKVPDLLKGGDCVDSMRYALKCIPKDQVEARRAVAQAITTTMLEEVD